MTRWLGRLFIIFSLVASFGAQAAKEIVPYVESWCASDWVSYIGLKTCVYPTKLAAAEASAAAFNVVYSSIKWAVTSCEPGMDINGDAMCSGTATHPDGSVQTGNFWAIRIHYNCPVPIVNPSIPYGLAWSNSDLNHPYACSRNVQDSLVITLLGGNEVEPSSGSTINTLPFIATVIDQNTGQPPTNPVQVHVSLKVDPTSGGHDHGDSTRPRGGIANVESCSSDAECWSNPTVNGTVAFNFNPTVASGTHTITATCDGCSNTATVNVDVKVPNLWPIAASTYYAFIGSTSEHSSNHYVVSEAQLQLWQLAKGFYDYQVLTGLASPTLLHLNDASLKWGGLFDKDGDWDTPHKEHRRGSVIDIRANSNPGAIPSSLIKNFIKIAANMGIDARLENIGDPVNQHFHTRLLNRKE
ncbi:DUF3869 domain-containing protein [Sideroxydans lithotrophicus]|nr:hypothetical protein [Sideroxydans lithotrophicus]